MMIKIPPSKNVDGTGVRIGTVKQHVAEEARRRLNYNSPTGDPLFNSNSKFFIFNRANGVSEYIFPSTESFWIHTNKKKKKPFSDSIELIISIGHRLDDEKTYDESDGYKSDYSERHKHETATPEVTPKMLCQLSDSARRRKRTAEVSGDHPAKKFVLALYTNKKSPVYHGLTYEHSLALTMYFTSHTWPGGKYVWQKYDPLGDSESDFPDLDELKIDAFSALLLSDEDKKIGKGLHPPLDGKNWPKKHQASGTIKGGAGVAHSLDKIGGAHLEGQLAMADAIKTLGKGAKVVAVKKQMYFHLNFFVMLKKYESVMK